MAVLHLIAEGSLLKVDAQINLTSTQSMYDSIDVDFSPEWDEYTKTAVFYGSDVNIKTQLLDGNGACVIPWECLKDSGDLNIGVYGLKGETILPTNFITHPIVQGAYIVGSAPLPPSMDVYQQIIAGLAAVHDDAEAAALSEQRAAESADDALESAQAAALSEGNAHDSELAAEQHKLGALDAKTDALGAKTAAEVARDISSAQAAISTAQAGISTTQAGVATAKAVEAAAWAAQLAAGVMSPNGTYADLAALNAADPDHSKTYITADNNNWNYWNGTAFVAGGVFITATLLTDPTLTKSAIPADAKVTGDRTNSNAIWTKDATNPLSYFPAPSAPLYFRREGTFTQAGSGDPSPTNIRPITPFMANGAQIALANSGKNLVANFVGATMNGITLTVDADGTCHLSGTSTWATFDIAIPLFLPGVLYRYSANNPTIVGSSGAGVELSLRKSDLSVVPNSVVTTHATINNSISGSFADNAAFARILVHSGVTLSNFILKPQLELGSVATPYEPYVGSTATLTAPEEIAAGWINNRGEGQATWARRVFDGTESWEFKVSGTVTSEFALLSAIPNGTLYSEASSSYVTSHAPSLSSGDVERHAVTFLGTSWFRINNQRMSGWDDAWSNSQKSAAFKAFLATQYAAGTPVTFVYRLATPQTITPVSAPINSIPALDLATERLNVFTSSLSGVLTYPKNKVRQDRILNNAQLWRKTASGNPVSAYPVPESPLYPKVSGTFTQAGTGDPSPSNIRPITPWLASGGTAKVKVTGKNLWPYPNPQFIGEVEVLNFGDGISFPNGFSFSFDAVSWSYSVGGGAFLAIHTPSGVQYATGPLIYVNMAQTVQGTVYTGKAISYYPGPITIKKVVVAPWAQFSGSMLNQQFEAGVATPYEPYSGQEIILTAPQEIAAGWMDNEGQGQVTWVRNILTGNETIDISDVGRMFVLPKNSLLGVVGSVAYSSHYLGNPYYVDNGILCNSTGWLTISDSEHAQSVSDFKSYLAAQYAAGTPVIVVYQLATPIPITPTITPLTATPQLDRITPRQNVLTASTGQIELTYAKSPIREADELAAAIALL